MNETTYVLSLATDPATGVGKDLTFSQLGRLFMAGREGSAGSSGLVEPLSPYEQSLWVFRCVSAILRSVSGVPLRLSRRFDPQGGQTEDWRACGKAVRGCRRVLFGRPGRKVAPGEIVEAGPARDLLNAPNPLQRWGQFIESLVGYWYLRGQAAVLLADQAGRRPRALHVLDGVRPDVEYDPAGIPSLRGYGYRHPKTGAPIRLAPDECLWVNFWGPGEPLSGMPAMRPGRLAISTDYAASQFNAAALANGGAPGVIFLFDRELTAEQKAEMRADYARTHGGPANANRPLFAGGIQDVKTLAQSFSELQFDQGKKTTRLELCALFGVPPVVAGWVEAAGDSSAYSQNALQQFWQQTVFPLLDDIAAVVQLIADRLEGGLEAWFDVEDQPVVQAMRLGRIDAATKLFSMGRPFSDINELLDLGLPDDEVSPVGFLPIGLTPAKELATGGGLSPVGPEGQPPGGEPPPLGPEGEPGRAAPRDAHPAIELASEAESTALWHAAWRPILAAQRAFGARIRAYFVGQEREVRDNLREALLAGGRMAKDEHEPLILRILFGIAQANARMGLIVRASMDQVSETALRQTLAAAGLAGAALEDAVRGAMASPVVSELIRRQAWMATSRVNGRTLEALQNSLREGLEAGESVNQLADRVGGIYQARRAQARAIAENTVGQVFSQARDEGQRRAGFPLKSWLHGPGAMQPRATHIAAGVRYQANPIPIDELFEIGAARLRYPRDYEAGSPEETLYCHCLSVGRFPAQSPREAVLAHLKACVGALT